MSDDVFANLQSLGIELTEPGPPRGSYQPIVTDRGIAYLSGSLPFVDGELLHPGLVGRDVTAEQAAEAAAQCAKNSLSVIHAGIGGLDKVLRVLKVVGFVASAPEFHAQPQVVNGASDLIAAVFGDIGRHARSAVGVASLPLGSCVEVEMVLAIVES